MTLINKTAPDFNLPDDTGMIHSLSTYRGSYVVLYFYPKDDTPGCTKEACSIRDVFPDLSKMDVVVIGISGDSENSHKKFKEKFDLPFILLSDKSKSVLKEYEANEVGKKRKTYIIDPNGTIVKEYQSVSPDTHGSLILEDIREIMV
ncbi:MAG: peroxiredoxin [Candidatus Paceibacterota bacterium]